MFIMIICLGGFIMMIIFCFLFSIGWLSKSFVPIIRQVVVSANPVEGAGGNVAKTKYATSEELEQALYNVRRELLVSVSCCLDVFLGRV